ncbi:ATP-binding protein [Antrihabitans cavernicola]|uniref:LuxR family transcriptional regulator n=1 Tax=Antrihabitans cavernicola TaxID=2495913 RepID=A0A5A7S4A6_9NOCA|nr:LuxR family transcriptional regulator [Spelaeibacter cavernicola]KAA0017060.1 LuxR family transcriptional regulator [Spelaeibacter cavernicola]
MPTQWPTLGRSAQLGEISRALQTRNGSNGVVVTGPAGVGKTTLARDAVRASGLTSRWIVGTESAKKVPLGAFSHLISIEGPIEPATVLRAARAELVAPGGPAIIGVDDAHHLDNFSATLVHQLAISGAVRLVVTIRDGEQAPDAITALWKDEWLTRVELGAFTREQTVELAEAVLDGPLEGPSVDRIFRVSEGNPLFLRHLIEAAIAANSLRQTSGVWQLRGKGAAIGSKLDALVETRLGRLTQEERHVLEVLSFAEPMALDALADLTSAAGVEGAEREGMIRVLDRDSGIVVRLGHPLYGEVLSRRIPEADARCIRSEIVRRLSDPKPVHVVDQIRLAALALDSDTPPDPNMLVDASRDALRLGDIELCERLAGGAKSGGGGFFASVYLCHALSWLGRGEEVEAELAQYDPDTLNEFELLHWGLSRAANMFWMLSRPVDARALLDLLNSRASERMVFDLVAALESMFLVYADKPNKAVEVATRVMESPASPPLARAWAASAAVLGLAVVGSFDGMDALADEGLEAAYAAETGLLRYTIGLGLVLARAVSGDLASARELGVEYVDFAELQQPARSLGGILLGRAMFGQGDLVLASAELRQAAAALEGTGLAWEMLAPAYLAQSAAAQGSVKDAHNALERAELLFGEKCAMHYPDLLLARAWVAASEKDVDRARKFARDAATAAEGSGQLASAALALLTAVQFGDDTLAAELDRFERAVPTPVTAAAARMAHGLADRNGEALEAVARDFERIGMRLVAADAFAYAAVHHASADHKTGEAAAGASARRLAAECGGAETLALTATAKALPLTTREREVATMVANDMSNKEIAEKLVVSIRTVEGHIYRACSKLHVPDRAGLATVMRAELR